MIEGAAPQPASALNGETSPARPPQTGFLMLLLMRRRRLIVTPLVVGAIVALYVLLTPRTYTTTVSFFPQARRSASSLSGLAAQFGVNIAGGEAAQSVQFYVDLIKSREVLGNVADGTVRFGTGDGAFEGPVWKALKVGGPDSLTRRDRAIRLLLTEVSSAQDVRSGIITLKVIAPSAELARVIAQRILDEVTRFNVVTRQSQAVAERKFTEQRLAVVRDSLRAAEGRLQRFLDENRSLASANLGFERDRLARDVAVRQSLFSQLTASYESAKIEEVRDTPVLTIISPPEAPLGSDARHLALNTALGIAMGFALAVLGTMAEATLSHVRRNPSPGIRYVTDYARREGGWLGAAMTRLFG